MQNVYRFILVEDTMMIIYFLDTSVFCNILNIHNIADKRQEAMEELNRINNSENEKIVLLYDSL